MIEVAKKHHQSLNKKPKGTLKNLIRKVRKMEPSERLQNATFLRTQLILEGCTKPKECHEHALLINKIQADCITCRECEINALIKVSENKQLLECLQEQSVSYDSESMDASSVSRSLQL